MAFTRFTKSVLNVSSLPDRVQNQAQALKATFDQAGVDIKAALNALISELEASTSAENIGADVQSVATKTVQAVLTAFEESISNRYTKTEAETLLTEGTNDLVSDIDVNLTNGVITVTKKDGTKLTFDTAIEKVPATFEIVENGDKFALKITNVDGTSTQTDITNFMNIYNFNNSDYITFEVNGEGNDKTVTANIKANSIGLDKLSLSLVSTLEGYANSAKDNATAAKTSETNAKTSETNALEAKNTAVTKASEASVSAAAAKTSENNAKYWAEQAQSGGGGGITEIPVATADTLGGIKVGGGLNITADGVLSATGGGETHTGYIEEELLGIDAVASGNSYTLDGNIFDYDEIVVTSYVAISGNHAAKNTLRIPTTAIVGNISDEFVINVDNNPMDTSNAYWYAIRFTFDKNGKLFLLGIVKKSTKWASNEIGIESILGIKYDIKVLDGAIDIDSTPTEASENVVTSGGIKAYVDERSIKTLEASTDNVIDFNTLQEEGIYLIKNCTTSTTLNAFTTINSTTGQTVYLQVTHAYKNGALTYVYQRALAGNITTFHVRQTSTGDLTSWGSWNARITANATAVATLTTAQVRNIKAQTTDLTAGTSALATGDIVFIYE